MLGQAGAVASFRHPSGGSADFDRGRHRDICNLAVSPTATRIELIEGVINYYCISLYFKMICLLFRRGRSNKTEV